MGQFIKERGLSRLTITGEMSMGHLTKEGGFMCGPSDIRKRDAFVS